MEQPIEPDEDKSLINHVEQMMEPEKESTVPSKTEEKEPKSSKSEKGDAPKNLPEPEKTGPIVPDQIVATDSSLPTDQAVAIASSVTPIDITPKKTKPKLLEHLKDIDRNKLILAGVALVLIIIFAVPFSRYLVLGLIIKQPLTVTVLDSSTSTPVSQAKVSYDGLTYLTNGLGEVKISAPLGNHKLNISKQYYKAFSHSYFVGFGTRSHNVREKLIATGRLVPINVSDIITTGQLSGALISVNNTSAKTNGSGLAELALPANTLTQKGTISLSGYTTKSVTIAVTNQAVKANDFHLTPAGQVYFLSNASGNIDVVKTNLDGSGRSTVYPGTGKEDPNNTSLLPTNDWQYLALESSRSGSPALYLIDTANDNITEFEQSGSDISVIGWIGHNFIYDLTNPNEPYSQAGREVIKSYDADNGQTNQLDQNSAQGNQIAYAYQTFANFNIVGQQLVYTTQWQTFNSDGVYNTAGLNDTIRGVSGTGQNKKDYQSFPLGNTGYLQAAAYSPTSVYFSVFDSTDGSSTYFSYSNQTLSSSNITSTTFSDTYPNYYYSPNGNQTFWSELVDGQDNLYVGDGSGNSKKQVASLDGYTPYGWYNNNYLLVTKNSSELYILSAKGLGSNVQPYKITDYYKSPQPGGGYGYGGI